MSEISDEQSVQRSGTELTEATEAPIVQTSDIEALKMADDPRLLRAFELIREVIADERAKTIADMLKGANASSSAEMFTPRKPAYKQERAPAGSARLLCQRTLKTAAHRGLTTSKIHDSAETEYERMVSVSAIRNELGTGEKTKPPRYRQVGGVWYLAEFAPLMKVINS